MRTVLVPCLNSSTKSFSIGNAIGFYNRVSINFVDKREKKWFVVLEEWMSRHVLGTLTLVPFSLRSVLQRILFLFNHSRFLLLNEFVTPLISVLFNKFVGWERYP